MADDELKRQKQRDSRAREKEERAARRTATKELRKAWSDRYKAEHSSAPSAPSTPSVTKTPQRFHDIEPLPPSRARRPGRPRYEPSPGEESREDRRKRQIREANQRYRASEWGAEQTKLYEQKPERKEAKRAQAATPHARELDAAKHRRLTQSGSIPMNYPKKGRPARMPWLIRQPRPDEVEREPFQPQGTQAELEKAARNREMVAKNEAAKPYRTKGGRLKKSEDMHPWFRKLGR